MDFHTRAGSQSVQQREMLYRLIVSQLRYDGYETAAQSVGNLISSYPPTSPSSRLSHLVQLGLRTEGEAANNPDVADMLPHLRGQGVVDLEYESDDILRTSIQAIETISAPEVSKYELNYVTSHKGPSLVATFSRNGRLAATGSGDSTIKVLDVDCMMSKTSLSHQQEIHPVIRTLFDHSNAVLALDFHPTVSVLASGSQDCTVKFFDYSKPSAKRSYRVINDVVGIKCIHFHPSGDYMLVGTAQSTLRLYDVGTLQCFVSSDSRDQHLNAITSVNYSLDGRLYTSSSADGSIKVWDGVSNRCVNTFKLAHGGEIVSSVKFSKNAKYILSSGRDGLTTLWELSTGRPLNNYKPPKVLKLAYSPSAVFNHTEDYVLMGEDRGGMEAVLCWDARTTRAFNHLVTGHMNTITAMAHSPVAPALITCSVDQRVRFFYHQE